MSEKTDEKYAKRGDLGYKKTQKLRSLASRGSAPWTPADALPLDPTKGLDHTPWDAPHASLTRFQGYCSNSNPLTETPGYGPGGNYGVLLYLHIKVILLTYINGCRPSCHIYHMQCFYCACSAYNCTYAFYINSHCKRPAHSVLINV